MFSNAERHKILYREKKEMKKEDNLLRGEEVVVRAKLHWINFLIFYIFIGIAIGGSLLILVIGITEGENFSDILFGILWLFVIGLAGVMGVISSTATELILTNKRLFGVRGLINKQSMDTPLSKINTVSLENSNVAFGDLHISTSSGDFVMLRLAQAELMRSAILEQIEIDKETQIEKQAAAISGAMK